MYGSYLWTLLGHLIVSFLLYFHDLNLIGQGLGPDFLLVWSPLYISVLLLCLFRLLAANIHGAAPYIRIAEAFLVALAPREILYFMPLLAWGSSLNEESYLTYLPLLGILYQVFSHPPDPVRLGLIVMLYGLSWAFDRSLGRLRRYRQDELEARLDLRESRLGQEEMEQRLATSLLDTELHARREEREGLSRELHDIIGHSLSATLMQIAAIRILNRQDDLAPLLEEVQTALDRGLKQTRETLHELHDESFSLQANIMSVTDTWQGIDVTLDLPGDVETLPIEVRYDLWAIIQEALTNFMRHSKNDAFFIRLRVQPAFYSLVIEDYPQGDARSGLSPVPVEDGMGLRNMRQVAFKYQGHLDAHRVGKGFHLRVILYRERK